MSSTDDWDLFGTPLQGAVKTHGLSVCQGQTCVIHNPTDHHMRDMALVFRMDRLALGERLCAHGVGHPDPDSLAHLTSQGFVLIGVHDCCPDQCCTPPITN